MKNTIELIEFTIPSWAICALINGDNSGNSDEDIEKIENFCNQVVKDYGNANFILSDEETSDLGFKYINDIDNLGSDCSLLFINPSI